MAASLLAAVLKRGWPNLCWVRKGSTGKRGMGGIERERDKKKERGRTSKSSVRL